MAEGKVVVPLHLVTQEDAQTFLTSQSTLSELRQRPVDELRLVGAALRHCLSQHSSSQPNTGVYHRDHRETRPDTSAVTSHHVYPTRSAPHSSPTELSPSSHGASPPPLKSVVSHFQSKEVQSGHQSASEEGIPLGYGRVAWRRGDGESPASLVTLPGAAGCGYVMCQRGGGVARSTPNITSRVWRTMRAALPSRPLSSPPPAGWAAGPGRPQGGGGGGAGGSALAGLPEERGSQADSWLKPLSQPALFPVAPGITLHATGVQSPQTHSSPQPQTTGVFPYTRH
ncbi:hypothetical protein GWK47_012489 [Chionoecetes opilio]|uniref:Uncharacterized protein n=1 Tax=Chionoecetes opilio TaxID=41210 RepID=A0A8J4XX86_CHIOP|nr:hypothetical protein GWK47_012489 [Chionoecetes opilio]